MTEKQFIQQLADTLQDVPDTVAVPSLRPYSPAQAQDRANRFSRLMAQTDARFASKQDRVVQPHRTLYRLAQNARLEVHHASGYLRFVAGLPPMEALFAKVESRDVLIRNIEAAASRLDLRQWIGQNEDLPFERLWQIKAASVDQQGNTSEPVLCRAVGAYRHHIGKIPVLGAASAVVKLAGNGELDAVSVSVRETSEQRLGSERVLRVDEGAAQLYAQLAALMGRSKSAPFELATPQWVRFGYLAQSRRQAQRVLAPVFMAAIDIQTEDVRQGYLLTVPATRNPLLVPSSRGADLPPDLEPRTEK